MNDGGGDGAGCFDIKEWADTTELTNVEVATQSITTVHHSLFLSGYALLCCVYTVHKN